MSQSGFSHYRGASAKPARDVFQLYLIRESRFGSHLASKTKTCWFLAPLTARPSTTPRRGELTIAEHSLLQPSQCPDEHHRLAQIHVLHPRRPLWRIPQSAPSPHMHLSAATRASHWACGTWTHLQLHYPRPRHPQLTPRGAGADASDDDVPDAGGRRGRRQGH